PGPPLPAPASAPTPRAPSAPPIPPATAQQTIPPARTARRSRPRAQAISNSPARYRVVPPYSGYGLLGTASGHTSRPPIAAAVPRQGRMHLFGMVINGFTAVVGGLR